MVVPIEVIVPSARLVLTSRLSDPRDRTHDVEALEERRNDVESK